MNSVGDIIATNRKKKGMSQAQLVELLQKEGLQITDKALSKWETNTREPGIVTFIMICRILGIRNIYEALYEIDEFDPLSTLNEEGKEKAFDYIGLLHDSGKYEKQVCEIIPFTRYIDIYENAVSAGTGNFLVDGPKKTVSVNRELLPDNATFGVRISGDSMEPEFSDGQIAWVQQQETVDNGEIGIFSLNGEAYIKKLQDDKDGLFLLSLNEKYAPIRVLENDRFDIFGKVVGKADADKIPEYDD